METSVAESEEQSSGETVARPEELRLLEALLFASTEPLEDPR
jgi:segregation and condensation protein B